ncbi:hypothetical protein N7462_010855 [Penicillium macrosclerotiorum]|uniref:uncharacterized protein n=1 Tax=Penicillium macrosclerotiorum TaxID=303699 RepID=UPI0025476122|nr:uncharacterized protein N7462_010855 [Penicillium macrosclerotiorum]KAJ5669785.1 hypothetical protein N7462_010855 [Penicillium macrosclerotiorum]
MTLNTDVASTYPLDTYLSEVDRLLTSSAPRQESAVGSTESIPHRRLFQAQHRKLSAEDNQYLSFKAAFELVPKSLQITLLVAYVKYVHPLLPALDLNRFLTSLIVEDDTKFESPLVYQAAMMASAAFVSDDDIVTAGFHSRNSLRKALFERTKLLYEFETEPNLISQIQALLLMTLWYEADSHHKDPYYWLDLACTAAERKGLLPSLYLDDLSPRQNLWWCLYARDRMISLAFQRPLRIQNNTLQISMLSFADLKYETYPALVHETLGSNSEILCQWNQEKSFALFKEQVKLTHCIGIMLEYLYQGAWEPSFLNDNYSLMPTKSPSLTMINACEDFLKAWMRDLPKSAQYDPSDCPLSEPMNRVFMVHQAFLRLLYMTAMSILYKTEDDDNLTSNRAQDRRDLKAEIDRMLVELCDFNLLLFLPAATVTILKCGLETSLLDLKVSDRTLRLQALSSLYTFEQAAWNLLPSYPSMEHVLWRAQMARSNLLGLVET